MAMRLVQKERRRREGEDAMGAELELAGIVTGEEEEKKRKTCDTHRRISR